MIKDLRYSIRSLLRRPAMTFIAVLTLALGIGLVTIQFSFVNAVLFKGLPFEKSERIMLIERVDQKGNAESVSLEDYFALAARQKSFAALAAFNGRDTLEISGTGIDAQTCRGAAISSELLNLFGVKPVIGRGFAPEDEQTGAPVVTLLGYQLWKTHFAGDSNIVGRSIRVRGQPATVVGVLPQSFAFPVNHEIWINLRGLVDQTSASQTRVDMIGRLHDDVTLNSARLEFAQLNQQAEPRASSMRIAPFNDAMRETELNIVMLSLFGVVCAVLALACLNVANLLSARAMQRGYELAIRSALGATRVRLVRQMLIESAILAAAGVVAGLLIAVWIVPLLNRAIGDSPERPFWLVIDIDYRVLAVTVVVGVCVALFSGLYPALRATGTPESLKSFGTGNSSARLGKLNRGLVVAQVAVSCAILVATGVLVDSVRQGTVRDLPFDPQRVLSAELRINLPEYQTDDQLRSFQSSLLENVRSIPGVTTATTTESYPFTRMSSSSLEIDDRGSEAYRRASRVFINPVEAGFFQDLGLPLRAGREFDDSDGSQSERVAIVTETFARASWGDESPLGKRVRRIARGQEQTEPWLTIVGVVADLPIDLPSQRAGIHVPFAQNPATRTILLITSNQPSTLARPLKDAVRSISADVPVDSIQTLSQRMDEDRRLILTIGGMSLTFGVAGLLLAGVGVYGVTSFMVQRRMKEFGIRIALGARPGDVLQHVFKQGAWQLLIGLTAGALAGWALSQPLKQALAGIAKPSGLSVYIIVCSCIALAMALALWWPARRAAKADPIAALRAE